MARTLSLDPALPHPVAHLERRAVPPPAKRQEELRRLLVWVVLGRALIKLLGVNLAEPLSFFPGEIAGLPSVPALNIFTALEAALFLALWWSGKGFRFQLYVQIAVDLCFTTALVANSHGIDSPFISFYLLIVLYSSLAFGRTGGLVGAAVSAILYATVIATNYSGWLELEIGTNRPIALGFRVFLHAVGFFSVAFLGTHLSQRVYVIQRELDEKIDSLAQLQRLNEHIVGSIRSGLVTTDLDGNIALFNRAAEEILGIAAARSLGRPVQDFVGPELWNRISSAGWLTASGPLYYETWVGAPGAPQRFVGFSVSPLSVQDAPGPAPRLLGYIVAFQDLTDMKRLEEEIRLKDRMAAIGRMAAGIAHEIRNPLTSMRGSVEVLRSHLALSDADARLMDILIRESERLNAFVVDFLRFAGPRTTARERTDLTALLRDTFALLRNSAEVRDKHTIELDLDGQVHVMGNPDQLRQVFWNLAQNAVRAMPAGGTLTIRARRTDGVGRVTFEDTGVGMSPEEQAQLFQPFNSGFAGGTGLGLSIVFQIVEDHKGKISLESEKGRGTSVTVAIPVEPVPTAAVHGVGA
jgi:two-component system sensor histidine kinase PilS (NtrC family)